MGAVFETRNPRQLDLVVMLLDGVAHDDGGRGEPLVE